MTESQCPNCGKTEIVQQLRLQNPETGQSIQSSNLGCIYQTAFATTLIAIVAIGFVVLQPAHAFRESASLIALITMVFVAAGIFTTWRHANWVKVNQYACKACKHTWMEESRQLAHR